MVEKNKDLSEVAQIEFNWERVKKRASDKRDELVNNSPNVFKRDLNTPAKQPTTSTPNRSAATRTTDTLIDPYHNIQTQAENMRTTDMSTSNPNPIAAETTRLNPHTDKAIDIDIYESDLMDTDISTIDTDISTILPLASPQGEPDSLTTDVCASDESLGPSRNAVEIIQGIKEKSISGHELTIDERRLVVKSMKELGQTQDAISDLLRVSRRTVVNDYKVLRQQQALAIQSTSTNEIAGEVYAVAKTCIRRALQAGSFKTVSVIMRDMVEVLQSLGILYRAPKTSMQATMHGSIAGSNTGYQKYMDGIGEDKNKVIDVLDCMFNAIDKDSV